jgi:hypothetical protein
MVFNILSQSSFLLHKEFIKSVAPVIKEKIFNYLNEMTQNELRSIRKDTLELIMKVLKLYLGLTMEREEREEKLNQFTIMFAVKMLKSTFLDKRIAAIKQLTDNIKISKNDQVKAKAIVFP